MDVPGPEDPQRPTAREASRSAYEKAADVVLTGFAVIIPFVVTLYVLKAAFNLITSALAPLILLLEWAGVITDLKSVGLVELLVDLGVYSDVTQFLTEIIAVLVLGTCIIAIGILASVRGGEQLIDFVDFVISAIPGIGTVYNSFRRMGDVIVESDVSNFRDVKLVEFPQTDAYMIGFETNESPPSVCETVGNEDLLTVFIPLAPNPVMGGHLAHVPESQTMDVDMSVEDGVRSIITSGIATPEPPDSGSSPDKNPLRPSNTPIEFDSLFGNGDESPSEHAQTAGDERATESSKPDSDRGATDDRSTASEE